MLTLYHFWSSTCSKKVRIALAEKNAEWESNHVDIVKRHENLEPEYVKLNPNGIVPTLIHDNKVIIESNIIIDYLDDILLGSPLKPSDPYQRAQMRLWMDAAELQVHKNINIISYNKRHVKRANQLFTKDEQMEILMRYPNLDKRASMIKRLENGVSAEEEQFAEARLADVMDNMEKTLEERTWLAGDTYSLADIAIVPFIERFDANGLPKLVDFDKRPCVGNWWQRIKSRAAYQTAYSFQDPN